MTCTSEIASPSGLPIYLTIPSSLSDTGLHIAIIGQLINAYNPPTGPQIPANSWVYLKESGTPGIFEYALPSTTEGSDLPFMTIHSPTGLSGNTLFTKAITLPDYVVAAITSGQVLLNVGAHAMKIPISSNGEIPAPTVQSNLTDKFGLFEWGWDTSGGLDIDVSEVDQVGVSFNVTAASAKVAITDVVSSANGATVTCASAPDLKAGDTVAVSCVQGAANINGVFKLDSPPGQNTVSIPMPAGLGGTYSKVGSASISMLMPAPAQQGVGLLPGIDDIFSGFRTYINGLDTRSNGAAFLQCAADNQYAPFPQNTRLTAPQDIVAKLQEDPPDLVSVQNSGEATLATYNAYYAITAVGDARESMVSNISGLTEVKYSKITISWNVYPYAKSYNVYWSQSPDLSNAILIKSGVTTTNYVDTSPANHTGSTTVPPTNNYNYDSLNRYFTQSLVDFFNYYKSGDDGHDFVLDYDSTTWKGSCSPLHDGSQTYKVLQLTGYEGQSGNAYKGDTVNVYLPFFTSNTDQNPAHCGGITHFPKPPSWLLSNKQSPSAMVFGASGAFDTPDDLSTAPAGVVKDILNVIDSAFQRGLTPKWNATTNEWENLLPPNYWAGNPNPFIVNPVNYPIPTHNTALSGDYYYGITAAGINSYDAGPGESTLSNLSKIHVTAPDKAACLQWSPQSPLTKASIIASSTTTLTVDNKEGPWPNAGTLLLNDHAYSYGQFTQYKKLINVVTDAQGTGYKTEDVLTVSGSARTPATIKVTTINGSGGITGFSVTNSGSYSEFDLPPLPNSPTGGSGSGATLGFNYQNTSIYVFSGLPHGVDYPDTGDVYFQAPSVAKYNIYRGTTPDNLKLIATVLNDGNSAVGNYIDAGEAPGTTPPPIQFYGKGSTANYYAAYVHQRDVSISGLAYGDPYDDQGGFSTNIQMRKAPASITIALMSGADVAMTVAANQKWQKTNVFVNAGKTLAVSYLRGSWTANPQDNNGENYSPNGLPIVAKPGYAMPGQNEGALIGRIGSDVFLIGSSVSHAVINSGELELCINDDLCQIYGAGFTDNKGSVEMQITVT